MGAELVKVVPRMVQIPTHDAGIQNASKATPYATLPKRTSNDNLAAVFCVVVVLAQVEDAGVQALRPWCKLPRPSAKLPGAAMLAMLNRQGEICSRHVLAQKRNPGKFYIVQHCTQPYTPQPKQGFNKLRTNLN